MTIVARATRRSLLAALFAVPAAAQAAFTLDTLMARMAAVPERRASFRETRRFAALDTELVSTGRLLYRRGTVEKVTDWPIPERLEVGPDRLVITAGNDPPRVIDAGMAPELRVLIDAVRGPLAGDTAALRRAFTPTLTGSTDGWTLDLAPRTEAARKLLRRVYLEGHGDRVDVLTITQANGDEQAMRIEDETR